MADFFHKRLFKLGKIVHHPAAFWALVACGIGFRLKEYLENHSLWVDEAVVAVNITTLSFREIFSFKQIFPDFARPPVLFLAIERTIVQAWGNYELALRLFPFISGILALVLFLLLLKRYFPVEVRLPALTFFVLSYPLIRYAHELKPYSSDLLIALGFYWLYERDKDRPWNWGRVVLWGILGAVLLWLSNSLVFVLAGIGGTLWLFSLIRKETAKCLRLPVAFSMWAASFYFLYRFSLSQMTASESIRMTWPGAFPYDPLLSVKNIGWFFQAVDYIFTHPGGFSLSWLAALLFLVGVAAFFRDDRERCCSYFSVIGMTFLASLMHKYPFAGRVVIFFAGNLFIFTAYGLSVFLGSRSPWVKIFGAALFLALIIQPLSRAADHLRRDSSIEHNRRIMNEFGEHYRYGDAIFMNSAAQYPFWYYVGQMELSGSFPVTDLGEFRGKSYAGVSVGQFSGMMGRAEDNEYMGFRRTFHVYNDEGFFRRSIFNPDTTEENLVISGIPFNLRHKGRAWLFITRSEEKEREIILKNFHLQGRLLEEFKGRGTELYLFELYRNPVFEFPPLKRIWN